MRLTGLLYILIGALCAFSCTQKPDEGKRASPSPEERTAGPSATPASPFASAGIMIVPSDPDRRSILALSSDGIDLTAAKIEWYVNGAPVPNENPLNLSCADLPRNSVIEVRVIMQDREIRSTPVTIVNTPPALASVRLLPEVFKAGDRFLIEATAGDLDGDAVTFQYAWTMNGRSAGKDATIDRAVKRGDVMQVTVTPFDGLAAGMPATVQREIRNFPPSFVEHTRYSFTGTAYVYQAQAADPDGDRLTYSLERAVDGVVVNPASGQVVWTVPLDFRGEQPVTLLADDGNGGTARYTVTFSVQ